ncbi:hypothetical protein [Mycetocola miduiensis]|uniref:Ester cyclase n=1 Tax=Mycetocola miduiensis TaxID=995034 RepID=A0A1I5AER9_9MICO|nr:hypothetical protein [Mycetocola miduiensis]SFN60954.1 hypothetical protein SAMN05216219_1402 [Mycetocola miduiensis]
MSLTDGVGDVDGHSPTRTRPVEVERSALRRHGSALPSGEIPPTGRSLKFNIAFFSRFDENGLIVDERRYYDVLNQLEQLGLAE